MHNSKRYYETDIVFIHLPDRKKKTPSTVIFFSALFSPIGQNNQRREEQTHCAITVRY